MEKPILNMAVVGPSRSGKTTLIKAILATLPRLPGLEHPVILGAEALDAASEERQAGKTMHINRVLFETKRYMVSCIDTPGDPAHMKNAVLGVGGADVVVIVTTKEADLSTDGASRSLAYRAICSEKQTVLPFLNLNVSKAEIEYMELHAMEPEGITCGSAQLALEVASSDMHPAKIYYADEVQCVQRLIRLIDEQELHRDPENSPFVMPIQCIHRRKTPLPLLVGIVASGTVQAGDVLTVAGRHYNAPKHVTVQQIRAFYNDRELALPGDCISVEVACKDTDRLSVGDCLFAQAEGSLPSKTLCRRIRVRLHMFSREVCGRKKPYFAGFRPQFYFNGISRTGVIFPEREENAMFCPGQSLDATAELITPLPLSLTDRGILMANGYAIGECFVTDIME